MGHRPIPTAPLWEFENNTGGQNNTWLDDVPELERLSAEEFIDWYLAKMEVEEPAYIAWRKQRGLQ